MARARIYPRRKMHRSRAPSIAPGTFFVVQSWAGYTTNMPGFDLRQAQAFSDPARGWAIGILLEMEAIRECEEHGHMRDRTDPDAWKRAREIASRYPFRGATPAEAVQALDDVMDSIGDTCPECK
jgi:hypothetical protein